MENHSFPGYGSDALLFPTMPVNYAGFWDRFAASFIDGLILIIPNVLLTYLFDDIKGTLMSIIMAWLYSALQESSNKQATLGKQAMGIRVTTLDGQTISFGQATGRHFGKLLSSLLLLIGYLMMLWDDKRQTLHDKMAGTVIVKP